MYNPLSNAMRDRSYEALVRDGITAAKNGNHRLAWSLLNQATQMNPMDPRPWIWLTETTEIQMKNVII